MMMDGSPAVVNSGLLVVDSWVREFDVSNPQKTHEGYTVYRISSKLYPKGSPEAASEVIVFKRYSEIRKLYKELKSIHDEKVKSQVKKFPHFSKANFFSRFDEAVIEERRRQALLLLTFAGNNFLLFTSPPFVHFFEGGVEHRGSSACSGASDDLGGATQLDNVEVEPWTPQKYFDPDLNSSDEDAVEDMEDPGDGLGEPSVVLESANKAWLARAMSLCSEGDDIEILASEAGYNRSGFNKDEERLEVDNKSELQESCIGDEKRHHSQGSVDLLPTLLESSEEEDLCEDEEDVFVDRTSPSNTKNTKEISQVFKQVDVEENQDGFKSSHSINFDNVEISDEHSKNMSCNMGDKRLEDDYCNEKVVENGKIEESIEKKDGNETRESKTLDGNLDNNILSGRTENDCNKMGEISGNDEERNTGKTLGYSSTSELSRTDDEKDKMGGVTVDDSDMGKVNGNESKETRREKKKEQVGRKISNIGMSWIDPRKKDYLYEAAQIIQQALYCEANERYEEAFNKYKMCVGILLQGVQHDGNSKRREAVRRKTAQYLLKAEFLYNTYLREDEDGSGRDNLTTMSTKYSGESFLHDVVDRRFRQLTLKSLKVIGVVRKVMLSQCDGLEGVFAVKVLHKTNAVHRNPKQETNQANKGYTKKYITSPYMVKLHQHFDTNNSIFLLLEYASGGALWDHIRSLRPHHDVEPRDSADHHGSEISPETGGIGTNENEPSTEREHFPAIDDAQSSETKLIPSHDASRLTDHVTDPSNHVEFEKCLQRWIAELLLAIASIHACGIILKDLKPANVLLDDDNHVVLTYFGIWEEVDHSVDLDAVERLYCAPEISCGEKITVSCDWWSLGVLSYELITGKTLSSVHPWGIHSHSSINFPTDKISAEACSFLKGLICHNPSERLGSGMAGAEEIKSHAFFTGIDWQQLSRRS